MKAVGLTVMLAFSSIVGLTQLEINAFRRLQFGALYDNTSITGAYILRDMTTEVAITGIEDQYSVLGAEIRGMHSGMNSVSMVNYEGILYTLNRILFKPEDGPNALTTPMDPLYTNSSTVIECPAVPHTTLLSNIHIFDGVTATTVGENGWLIGMQASLRRIGLAHNITTFRTATANQEAYNSISQDYKILAGLNVGYRKAILGKVALFAFAGLNTGLNTRNHLNDADKASVIQVKYSPWVNIQAFFGHRKGLYCGLYWEKMVCRDNYAAFLIDTNDKVIQTAVGAHQLQLKLGFFISLGSDDAAKYGYN